MLHFCSRISVESTKKEQILLEIQLTHNTDSLFYSKIEVEVDIYDHGSALEIARSLTVEVRQNSMKHHVASVRT